MEHPRPWGEPRRAAESTPSLQAAQAALRGAQARPEPADGPARRSGRGRPGGQTAPFVTSRSARSRRGTSLARLASRLQSIGLPPPRLRHVDHSGDLVAVEAAGTAGSAGIGALRAVRGARRKPRHASMLQRRRSGVRRREFKPYDGLQGGRCGAAFEQGRRRFRTGRARMLTSSAKLLKIILKRPSIPPSLRYVKPWQRESAAHRSLASSSVN